MKKFLLSIACALVSVMGMAQTKTYTDALVVSINGTSTEPQNANVLLTDNGDGTYKFALKNFILWSDGEPMPVGNIEVDGLNMNQGASYKSFDLTRSITVGPGDEGFELEYEGEMVPLGADDWAGPALGELPVTLKGKFNDDKMYVNIDIYFAMLDQNIHVEFGSDDFNTKTYTDALVVTINGTSTEPQNANVLLTDNGDGTYKFALKNFILWSEGEPMPVGNIEVDGMNMDQAASYKSFDLTRTITVGPGDEGFELEYEGEMVPLGSDDWAGPALGELPVTLKGKFDDNKMYVNIDLYFAMLDQNIHVEFGSDTFKNTYTVNFEVEGNTVATETVEEGASVTAPEVEEREGYTFAWGEIPAAITEDVTIKGTYTVNTYTVTYTIDGEVVGTATVAYGEKVPAGEYTEREGYTFAWGEAPEAMPAHDVTVAGTYTANHYTVTYKVGDEVIATYDVVYGEAMPAAPEYTPESDDRYTRTLAGWDGESCETVPAHDVVYTAIINVVDAINAVSADETGVIYDINGRRVSRIQRGVYIVNGKKYIK